MKLLFGPDADEFELSAIHGRVVGDRTWSETHIDVQSSHSTDHYGHLNSYTSVSGTPNTRNRVFLELADRKQAQVDYNGSFGTLPGHRISVVRLHHIRSGRWQNARLYNHMTGADAWQSSAGIVPYKLRSLHFGLAGATAFMCIPMAFVVGLVSGDGPPNTMLLAIGLTALALCLLIGMGGKARARRLTAKLQVESDRLIAGHRPA